MKAHLLHQRLVKAYRSSVVGRPTLIQRLLKSNQELKGSLVFSFSIQSVGFDVTPQALRVAESVTLTMVIETNEYATCTVMAKSKSRVVGCPLHAARNSARLSI